MSACRSCGAAILWARTKNGKAMPLDAEPTPEGNVVLTGEVVPSARGAVPICEVLAGPDLFGAPLRMPHHATCPQADKWRRR